MTGYGGMLPDQLETRQLHVRTEGKPRNLVEDHARSHTNRVGEGPVWKGRKQERSESRLVQEGGSRTRITGGRGKTIHLGDLARHVCCVSFGGPSFQFTLDTDAMGDTSPVRDDPDSPQNIALQLGVPGMPEFFASILRFIRTTAPGVPLDPVIFQTIMLSVMAGNKHVILRAKDEDITVVQNLAALVSNPTLVCP